MTAARAGREGAREAGAALPRMRTRGGQAPTLCRQRLRVGRNHSPQGAPLAPLSECARSGTSALSSPPRAADGTLHARSAAQPQPRIGSIGNQPGLAPAEGGRRGALSCSGEEVWVRGAPGGGRKRGAARALPGADAALRAFCPVLPEVVFVLDDLAGGGQWLVLARGRTSRGW